MSHPSDDTQPTTTGKGWERLATAIAIFGLLLFGWVIVANSSHPSATSTDEVATLSDGTEVPVQVFLASGEGVVPADPTVTDLRDREGRNGMWYQIKKSGTITRLWRDGEYICVQFADGRTGKCTKLQKLQTGNPFATLTHVKEFQSGQTRQNFIHFEVTVPAANLAAVRRIQRGGAGSITF